jgi:two-component system cell cycle sensor histidine kinase/response regulator CckA
MKLDVFPVVLVVDDDRGQVALVTSFLQKAGFRVVSANSAEEALAALERAGEASRAISLLVTDLDMPGMSGRTFAAQLMKQHPKLKVLYVTASADVLFQQGRELGANEAFLEKPVSAQALREAVNLLLQTPRPPV